MDRCPLCESFALVTLKQPCYFCGFTWIQIDPGTTAAVVPGHMLLDLPEPASAKSLVGRLAATTRHVFVDLNQFRSLSSVGIDVMMATRDEADKNGIELALVNVSPNVKKLFQICQLGDAFRILEDFKTSD